MKIQDYLAQKKMVTDGSFGTYYAEKYETQKMPELANLMYPERVAQIHSAYLAAGADFLRTNTFASNTVSLGCDINGVKENIRLAAKIAGQAASQANRQVFVAGDIGPIPDLGQNESTEQYIEIARTFVAEGIDILLFETFPDMERLYAVLEQIKKEAQVFVMVQFAVNQFGCSSLGFRAKRLLGEAATCEWVDAVGLNCGVGPVHMRQLFEKSGLPEGKYLTALPNAGYPRRGVRQLEFANTPRYFANQMTELASMGIDIVGGCCGTNPAYIAELAMRLDRTQTGRARSMRAEQRAVAPAKKSGFLYERDGAIKKKKLIAVELSPPVDANEENLLRAAHQLKRLNVDVLTVPDSPSGRTRADSVLVAAKIKLETGMEVMPHICCRDKNAIAMRSLFMGAYINDIHNFLLITGDPIPSVARSAVKGVFNFDSTGLMKIVEDMNEETFADSPMCYGGAINQGRRNLDVEIGRIKKKMSLKAAFFLTQPVFCREEADRLRQIKEETGARILCGIMPLVSRKNALFMKNEIAGIYIPDEIVERYPVQGTRAQGEAAGIAIAREIMELAADFADGYYFSFPFNRVNMLEKILK